MSNPQSLATLIPLVFDDEHQWKYQLLKNWQAIFGKLSDKVYLERIQNDILILAVYDACWMHELYALSDVLLASINKTLDKPYIKQLRFKRAGTKNKKNSNTSNISSCQQQSVVTLTAQEQRTLGDIKDQELAAVLKDFLVRCYKERPHYDSSIKRYSKSCSDKLICISSSHANKTARRYDK